MSQFNSHFLYCWHLHCPQREFQTYGVVVFSFLARTHASFLLWSSRVTNLNPYFPDRFSAKYYTYPGRILAQITGNKECHRSFQNSSCGRKQNGGEVTLGSINSAQCIVRSIITVKISTNLGSSQKSSQDQRQVHWLD
jgi:hypothetical protein